MKHICYGMALILLGIVACLVCREDVSAGVVLILMGLAVLFAKEEDICQ